MIQSTNRAGCQNVVASLNAGIDVGAVLGKVTCLTAQRLRYSELKAFGSFDRCLILIAVFFLSTIS